MIAPAEPTRQCSKCARSMPLRDFHRFRSRHDALRFYHRGTCKKCRAKQQRARRLRGR